MRTHLTSAILFALLFSSAVAMRAQPPQSLGDVARQAWEQKANTASSKLAQVTPAAEAQAQPGPMTQLQLYAWLVGGLSSEDQIRELHARGIAFEPDEPFLRDLAAAGADASLISELHSAHRHLSASPAQDKSSVSKQNADSSRTQKAGTTSTQNPAGGLPQHADVTPAQKTDSTQNADNPAHNDATPTQDAAASPIQKAIPAQNALSQMGKVATAAKKRDYRVALRLMTPLLQSDPNNPDLLFALGNIFSELEDWENASRAFAREVELLPQFAYAHGQLSLMYYRMGDGERAEQQAQAMLKLLPESSDAHRFLGLALSAEDDDEGAFQEYARALQLNPNNGMVYYDIGVLRAAQKNWEEAIVAYRRAIKLGPPRWYFYNNLGNALAKVGRVEEAIKAFDKGRELDQQNPQLLQSYGALLCNSGRDAQAVEIFTQLLAATPDWNMARPCLYRSLMHLGRTAEANHVKEDYAKYSPDHSSF